MDSNEFSGDFSNDTNFVTGGSNSAGLSTNPIPFSFGSCTAGEAWADCFAGGSVVIPQAQWNSIASAMVSKYVPAANIGTNTYSFNAGSTAAQDQGIIRVDYTPSAKDTIWGSTVIQSSPSANELSFGGGEFPGIRPACGGALQDIQRRRIRTRSARAC